MSESRPRSVQSTMSEWKHRWFGFWNLTSSDLPYPRARDVIDLAFEPEDKPRIIEYLRDCPIVLLCLTQRNVKCEFCDEYHSINTFQSDGEWLWPNSLAHYVEHHNVAIPDSLVRHIRDRKYEPCASDVSIDINTLDWPSDE